VPFLIDAFFSMVSLSFVMLCSAGMKVTEHATWQTSMEAVTTEWALWTPQESILAWELLICTCMSHSQTSFWKGEMDHLLILLTFIAILP